jgi:hypothetical protein
MGVGLSFCFSLAAICGITGKKHVVVEYTGRNAYFGKEVSK